MLVPLLTGPVTAPTKKLWDKDSCRTFTKNQAAGRVPDRPHALHVRFASLDMQGKGAPVSKKHCAHSFGRPPCMWRKRNNNRL